MRTAPVEVHFYLGCDLAAKKVVIYNLVVSYRKNISSEAVSIFPFHGLMTKFIERYSFITHSL